MNRPALPVEHTGVRWFLTSLYLTSHVLWLLYQLESLRNGEPGFLLSFGRIGEVDGRWIALLVAGLALVNAWLFDGLLEVRTYQHGRTRPGIRAVRFLALGLPLVGIYTVSTWLSILDSKPEWVTAPLTAADSPPKRLLLVFSRTQWLRLVVPFFMTLLIGNLFFLGAAAAWLGATRATLLGIRLTDLAAWALRLLGIAAGLVFMAAQRSASVPLRVPRIVPWLLLLLWALPWPWCMAGAVVLLAFDPQRRPSTLVQETFRGRQPTRSLLMELGGLNGWRLSLLQRFRWLSGRSPAQPAEVEKRLAGLYRLKTFLLFPEVALLAFILVEVTGQAPVASSLLHLLLVVSFYGALALALAGVFWIALAAIRRFRAAEMENASPADHPRWSLVLASLAVAAGIASGDALGRGDVGQLQITLWNIGLMGLAGTSALSIPFRFGKSKVHHRGLPMIAWFFVFAGISYAGSWIAASGTMGLAIAVLCCAPIASIAAGAASSRWLLHPFSVRDLGNKNLSLQLRLTLAFLAATAWAPGGGLATPLWAAARRRLWSSAAPPPSAPLQPRPAASRVSALSSLPPEKRDYVIRHTITHQVEKGAVETLFQRLEKHPFLADQANSSGGFRRGSEDVEGQILPLVLQRGDWERFLRYSALAINLRRIADDLADPDLLPALARHGHRQMALDAAARVSDPVQRALGRAILAASLDPADTDRETLLGLVREDLGLLAPIDHAEEAETRALALVQIGFQLGPEILPALQRIPRPREGQEPRPGLLAMSTALGALQRNRGLDAKAWEILQSLPKEVLAEFLPDALSHAVAAAEPAQLLESLSTLDLAPEALWACRLSILAGQARTSPEEACRSWRSLPAAPPLPWSPALIDRGAPLFAILADPEIDALARESEDPVARAALRVAVLEHRQGGAPDSAAREAVERLPPGPERLHWTLRRAAASPMTDEARRREVRAIGQRLFEQQYRAPFDDLRRYLELAARCLPADLVRNAEDVVLSPRGGAPLLFHLAETCASRAVLENLFEQAESYLSSLVGLPDLEGLRLWRGLMYQLTGRLCLLRGDLTPLEQAAEKLLEADDLAARVTGFLAGAGAMELAAAAAGRIRSGRLSLTTRLRWLPETAAASRDLEPESLYSALASATSLEDEWLGLAALHDPGPPEILFQRFLDRISDRDTLVVALFRLARHVLDQPQTTREEGQLALQMLGQALSSMQSHARLVALTPWLPELMARVDPGRASEEYREAFARLIGLHTVSWPARRDALERLLVQLSDNRVEVPGLRPLFAGFEQLVADGIPGQDESAAADFLPVLTAARERLPPEAAATRSESLNLRFLDAESEQIRALCRSSGLERVKTLESWSSEPPFRIAQALAYLLVRERSGQALALLDRLPAGSQKYDLCRRLVVHGWATGRVADEIIRRMGSTAALDARLFLPLTTASERDPMRWMELLASRAADDGVDPSEPAWGPVLGEIWRLDPRQSRPALAEAVLTALGREAPQIAENALRLWLHAHLSPCQQHTEKTRDRAFSAIHAALAL